MQIRNAKEADLRGIAPLLVQTQSAHVQAYPHRYLPIALGEAMDILSACLSGKGFWVATDNDRVVGYAVVEYIQVRETSVLRARRYAYLQQLAVEEASQRQGIGRRLVAHIKRQCMERGIVDIELDVWAFNAAAKAFFQGCGFGPYASRMRVSVEP